MRRYTGRTALLVCSLAVFQASAALAQVRQPPPATPPPRSPGAREGAVTGPPSNAPPSSFTITPDRLTIGAPLTFTVGVAAPQAGPSVFKVLSDLNGMSGWSITVPAGRTSATASRAWDPLKVGWRTWNFCVTPVTGETSYPCVNKGWMGAAVQPLDPATVRIAKVIINGDNGTGTPAIERGKAFTIGVNLNAVPNAANITVRVDAMNHYTRIVYANGVPVAADAPFVPLALPFGGKRTPAVVSAELNGAAVTRNVEFVPLKQVEKVCFYDDKPTAGSWSHSTDYCTWEIPGKVTGGQQIAGFIRRGVASQEDVFVELSSSDPAATLTFTSASIIAYNRGVTFYVKTTASGGTPRNVTIKVLEGGTYATTIPLTIQ